MNPFFVFFSSFTLLYYHYLIPLFMLRAYLWEFYTFFIFLSFFSNKTNPVFFLVPISIFNVTTVRLGREYPALFFSVFFLLLLCFQSKTNLFFATGAGQFNNFINMETFLCRHVFILNNIIYLDSNFFYFFQNCWFIGLTVNRIHRPNYVIIFKKLSGVHLWVECYFLHSKGNLVRELFDKEAY